MKQNYRKDGESFKMESFKIYCKQGIKGNGLRSMLGNYGEVNKKGLRPNERSPSMRLPILV